MSPYSYQLSHWKGPPQPALPDLYHLHATVAWPLFLFVCLFVHFLNKYNSCTERKLLGFLSHLYPSNFLLLIIYSICFLFILVICFSSGQILHLVLWKPRACLPNTAPKSEKSPCLHPTSVISTNYPRKHQHISGDKSIFIMKLLSFS